MADTSNLSQFLTDVAGAIKEKTGKTDKIPAANFDQEILSIETGVDTSDATAVSMDIIAPKTAYVKGSKVTGGIIPTYDASVPSELGRNINLSGITIDDVNLDINLAIRASSGSSIEVYDIINDTISSETKTIINLTALTDTSVISGTGRFNTTITMINNKEYIRCYLMTKSSTTAYYVYSFLLNLQDKTIINEALVSIGEGASHAISLVVVPDKDIVISSTTGKNSGLLTTRVHFVCFNDASGTASVILNRSDNGLAGSRSVANICVAPDKRTIGIFNHFNFMSFGTGTRAFTCVIRVSTDGTSYSTIQSNTVVSELCMLIDENTFIQNNSIKQIGTQASLGTSPFTINYGDKGILIGKYFYYLPSGSKNYSVYEWDSNEKTFTAVSTLTTNGGAILHFAKEILYKNTDNALTGYVNDSTKGALMALYRNNTTFYNTQYANDISASNVLKNKKYFDINGLGIGTMPNNGELNYTPSDSEQVIPAGYTSGGTVSAAVMTNDDYQTCMDLADYIMYGGEPPLPYTELEYIQGTKTQYIITDCTYKNNTKFILKLKDIVKSDGCILHAGTSYSGTGNTISLANGAKMYWSYDGDFRIMDPSATAEYTIEIEQAKVKVNGNVYSNSTTVKSSGFGTAIRLFNSYNNANPTGYKFERLTIYEGTTLVRDYIPVKRNIDNEVCIYDLVTEVYHINQGTGNFIAGPEITNLASGAKLNLTASKNNGSTFDTSLASWRDLSSGTTLAVSTGTWSDNALNCSKTEIDTKVPQSSLIDGYTIIARINSTEWVNFRGLFGLHYGTPAGIIGFQATNGVMQYSHYNNKIITTSLDKFPINTWLNIVARYNSSNNNTQIYVNGELVNTMTSAVLKAQGNIILGKAGDITSSSYYFKGKISHFIIYDRTLTDTELDTVYNYIESTK